MDKNEAIKIIRSNFPTGRKMLCEALEILIPELKESEDERIRKELKSFFDSETSDYGNVEWRNGIMYGEIVAWLEKQGENTYNKELSELLHVVICRFINNPDIPYSDREKVSKKIIPYVEKLEKQYEQKPTWSEEDEDSLDIAIRIIQNKGDDCAGILDSDKAFKWLKSLKQRMKGE